jgi:hypothetical protein
LAWKTELWRRFFGRSEAKVDRLEVLDRWPPIGRQYATPSGELLFVRWLAGHDRWEVRRAAGADWFESRDLALALALAAGVPPDAPWIKRLLRDVVGEQATERSGRR